jgi:hypothetical protein
MVDTVSKQVLDNLGYFHLKTLPEMSHGSDLPGHTGASSQLWLRRDRPILAYGFMLLAAVILVLNYFIKFPTFPDDVVAGFREYRDRNLPLQIETSDAATLERYFVAEGVPVSERRLDLATCTLKGGGVQRALNRKGCWLAYQGPGNARIVFQGYPGSIAELPGADEIRWDQGRAFHIFTRAGTTAVFWQEKSLCWVLISDAAPEETIRLALSGARV